MRKKIKNKIGDIRDSIDDRLRYFCHLLSPENRVLVILVLLLLGTILNFYFMFSTINNWGENNGDEIEHVKTPDIPRTGQDNNLNFYDYEENRTDTQEDG